MKHQIIRISVLSILVLAAVGFALTGISSEKGPSLAIFDDPNPLPVGSDVVVHVINPAEYTQSGRVVVYAWLGSTPARSSVPVTVDANRVKAVNVPFGSTVTEIINVGIIEDPDPIP